MTGLLHSDLCQVTARWLKSVGCGVTAVELVTHAAEQPDAIGWKSGRSILCEVKLSRSDFHADRRKRWRTNPENGMGDWRFYVAPRSLLAAADMPDGWGLLEWDGKRLLRTHNVPVGNTWAAPPFVGNKVSEALVLCSLVRRLEHPHTDRRAKNSTVAEPKHRDDQHIGNKEEG